jgi:hypothetical protein
MAAVQLEPWLRALITTNNNVSQKAVSKHNVTISASLPLFCSMWDFSFPS